MRAISVHVDEDDYESLKTLAERSGRPVAMLIREAMADYLGRARQEKRSILALRPRRCGRQLAGWDRGALFDEMIGG